MVPKEVTALWKTSMISRRRSLSTWVTFVAV